MASLNQQYAKFKARKLLNFKKAAAVLHGEMQNIVAEKTYELEESLAVGPLQELSPGRFLLQVGSFGGVAHAPIVEYGVKGKVYNYHRYKGSAREVVHVGVGQAWRARSLENTKAERVNIMAS